MTDVLYVASTVVAVLIGLAAGLFIVGITVWALVECLPSRIARHDDAGWDEWE